jgi:hypothetical protein
MRFYTYDKSYLEEKTYNSDWSCTHIDKKYIGCKPYLNNSYHHIYNLEKLNNSTEFECDFYIVPLYIRHTNHMKDDSTLKSFLCKNLKYFSEKPDKHIFFLGSDSIQEINCLENSIVFAYSAHKSSNKIALPYQPIVCPPQQISDINLCLYDVSFQGYLCNEIRKKTVKKVADMKSVVINSRYWFHKFMGENTSEIERNYCGLMQMSKFILCPKGFGLNSIRFFEAMSYGRIPILISDNTKLPMENKINYDEFMIRIPENEIETIPERMENFKQKLSYKSKMARSVWEMYFTPNKFHIFINESLNSSWL